MPSWLNDLTQPDRLIPVAVTMFLLWLIVRSVFKSWPFIANFVRLVNTLVGDDKKPGIAVRMDNQTKKLAAMEEQIATIHHEVTPNHGGSMNDGLKRVEHRGKETQAEVAEIKAKFERHVGISKEHDAQGAETARKLEEHIRQTEQLMPMLEDLHKSWAEKPRIPPPG